MMKFLLVSFCLAVAAAERWEDSLSDSASPLFVDGDRCERHLGRPNAVSGINGGAAINNVDYATCACICAVWQTLSPGSTGGGEEKCRAFVWKDETNGEGSCRLYSSDVFESNNPGNIGGLPTPGCTKHCCKRIPGGCGASYKSSSSWDSEPDKEGYQKLAYEKYSATSEGYQKPAYYPHQPAYEQHSATSNGGYKSLYDSYATPKPDYSGPEQQNYRGPDYNSQPRPNYNQPQPAYNPPQPDYNEPQPKYPEPKSNYYNGPRPQPDYAAPQPNYPNKNRKGSPGY